MYKILKSIYDSIVGFPPIRSLILSLFGYQWNGWFLGLVGYRAINMIRRGENCIIAGIYAESTIRDFSAVVGAEGRVIVVEANPFNVERLQSSTKDLKNASIINRAIWREKGEMEFLMSAQEKDQGYNRLSSDELQEFPVHMDQKPEAVTVPTDTLDNIAEEFSLGQVNHINLTINGAELQCLEAISKIRTANPKVRIYINSETPDPANNVIEKLKELGFKVFVSNWIRTINKKIHLVRIYAVG